MCVGSFVKIDGRLGIWRITNIIGGSYSNILILERSDGVRVTVDERKVNEVKGVI